MSGSASAKIFEFLYPRMPYRGSPNTVSIQRHRNLCRLVCVVCFIAWIELYLLAVGVFGPRKLLGLTILTLIVFNCFARAFIMSLQYLLELKRAFSKLCLEKLAERLYREDPKRGFIDIKAKTFLFHPDLEEVAGIIRLHLLTLIKEVRVEKRRQKAASEQARLQRAHDQLDRELMEAAQRIGKEQKVRSLLRRNLSLSSKRSFLVDLARFTVLGSRSLTENKDDEREQKLVDYLVGISSNGLCNEARRLHALARQASDIKTRGRYLKEAIEAQRESNRQSSTTERSPEAPEGSRVLEPVGQQRLWDYAREVFAIKDLLPSNVDETMATAILLLLIGPGTKARRFQAKYWPKESLKREVVHHYMRLLRISFPQTVFENTLKWLDSQGILFSKVKRGERMYSLSSKPSNGETPNSQDVIRRVISATEAFKS